MGHGQTQRALEADLHLPRPFVRSNGEGLSTLDAFGEVRRPQRRSRARAEADTGTRQAKPAAR